MLAAPILGMIGHFAHHNHDAHLAPLCAAMSVMCGPRQELAQGRGIANFAFNALLGTKVFMSFDKQREPSNLGVSTEQLLCPPHEELPLLSPISPALQQQPSTALWPPRAYEAPTAAQRHARGWRGRLSSRSSVETWEFPGWGGHYHLSVTEQQLLEASLEAEKRRHADVGRWAATAVGANDVLSSCFYVIGLVAVDAGKLTPAALLLVVSVLWLIWGIYGEAITALPFNGGAYNVLINSTSKVGATVGGTLVLISYVASGVVAATTAAFYMQTIVNSVDAVWFPIGLMILAACVSVLGIRVSSSVALCVLAIHTTAVLLLCGAGLAYVILHPTVLLQNMHTPFPEVDLTGDTAKGSIATALFFGYATGMLGVSGFEDSSQFVQEQAPGVFLHTLKYMWLGAAIFNPLLSVVVLGVLPLDTIRTEPYIAIAHVARELGGWLLPGHQWAFQLAVVVDAAIALFGAVLAAYVGVNGLMERMARDRCLPPFVLMRSKLLGTTHNITLSYFAVCTGLLLFLQGDIDEFAGVFSLSFLSVLAAFIYGLMLLKFKRPSLARDMEVSLTHVLIAFAMVLLGLLGNLLGDPRIFSKFCYFVFGAAVLFLLAVQRARFLRLLVICQRHACPWVKSSFFMDEHAQCVGQPAVFFYKQDNLYLLNKALLYVIENEHTQHLMVVHCYNKKDDQPTAELARHVSMLDTMYPRIKVTLVSVDAPFCPELVEWLSKDLNIPKNSMFIACPDERFTHEMELFEGCRIITH